MGGPTYPRCCSPEMKGRPLNSTIHSGLALNTRQLRPGSHLKGGHCGHHCPRMCLPHQPPVQCPIALHCSGVRQADSGQMAMTGFCFLTTFHLYHLFLLAEKQLGSVECLWTWDLDVLRLRDFVFPLSFHSYLQNQNKTNKPNERTNSTGTGERALLGLPG